MSVLGGSARRVAVVVTAALLGGALTAGAASWRGAPESHAFTADRPRHAELPADVVGPATGPRGSSSARKSGRESGREAGPATRGAQTRRPARPSRLRIDALDLVMPVRPTGVDRHGAMALPADPAAVGWYRFGADPLAAGATVLAGHVDTARYGIGPLARIGALSTGDRVAVQVGRRSVTYRVTSVTRVAKDGLDTDALFSRTGPARLHLVTCGGAYRPGRGYEDNVVVAARRLGQDARR